MDERLKLGGGGDGGAVYFGIRIGVREGRRLNGFQGLSLKDKEDYSVPIYHIV